MGLAAGLGCYFGRKSISYVCIYSLVITVECGRKIIPDVFLGFSCGRMYIFLGIKRGRQRILNFYIPRLKII